MEFPQFWRDGTRMTCGVSLADPCRAGPDGPEPDLVLLQPDAVPESAVRLAPASAERYETGNGYAFAGLPGRDPSNPSLVQEVNVPGVIVSTLRSDRRRQFSGANPQGYWTDRGSSGSPVFLEKGEQLAGIISLSETGRKSGESPIHEAFVVPGTLIRRYLEALAAVRRVAESERVPAARLQPILDAIGAADTPPDQMPERLHQFVEAARARGAEQVRLSNEGADIDAVIGAARDKLGALDVAGARGVLQAKIAEEDDARRVRMLPLLKERAAIERLAFDHAAAQATFGEITRLSPDDVWAWIDLGREWLATGPLDSALGSFRSAQAAAESSNNQRDLAVSRNWIGDVLVAQGDLPGALEAYRKSLAIAETLAARDPGNIQWQHDLSISHERLGDVLEAQGDLPGALDVYRKGLAIRETLAVRDARNTQWQRGLSASHFRIGDVLKAQGNLPCAMAAYRKCLEIADKLVARDPSNTLWRHHLLISHERVGNMLMQQDDLPGAMAEYRTRLEIVTALTVLDTHNTFWQRELAVSHNKIGDVLKREGDLPGALEAHRKSLAIRDTLAGRDAGNTQWQRDLSVSLGRVADTLIEQRNITEARPLAERALTQVRAAIARFPDDPRIARDLPYYESLLLRAGGTP